MSNQRAEAAKERFQERILSEATEARKARYTPVLSALGLNSDQIETVSLRLKELHREAMTAGDEMGVLVTSRFEHDKEMRSLLGDEGYQKYRAFESAKPFQREVEAVKALSSSKQATIDPSHESKLVELFQAFNLQSMESWDGPYDPVPSPLVGKDPIVSKRQATIESLVNGLAGLQETAEWRQLPEEVTETTALYFAQRIEALQRGIESLSLAPEEKRRRRAEFLRGIGMRAR